jgi:hypothetical protein
LGRLGLGRKRVRQPVTAALGAKRAKQAAGHVRLRAKLAFLLLFFIQNHSFNFFCSDFEQISNSFLYSNYSNENFV